MSELKSKVEEEEERQKERNEKYLSNSKFCLTDSKEHLLESLMM